MNVLVRCKMCGYVMAEGALKDVCPACGVSRKLFEPFVDPVEPARRRFLALDLHPVVVHAPQALTFLPLLLELARPFLPAAWLDYDDKTVVVMALMLPVTAAGAFATGLIDAQVRFRRFRTPMLRQKMVVGVAFFVLALAMAWLALHPGCCGAGASRLPLLAVNILAFACCSWLGIIGAKLVPAVFIKVGPVRKPDPAAGSPGPVG
jgi:hypothetical protein